ncbi:hypothetical protein VTK56DRAFT_1712 [Thermocarpiscus australiensis]
MAPTAPSKPTKRLTARQKARARLADPLLPRKLHRENNVVADSFINSKRDKRLIKHSAFVSRITKAASAKTDTNKKNNGKRRRPSKKLVTTLESLGDALDDIREAMEAEAEKQGAGGMMDAEQARQGKVRHKSLRTRPGALKRKERVVRGEMERFGRSLAQLVNINGGAAAASAEKTAGTGTGSVGAGGDASRQEMDAEMGEKQEERQTTQTAAPSSATSSRWAALRGFISATMEQNPAFLGKT